MLIPARAPNMAKDERVARERVWKKLHASKQTLLLAIVSKDSCLIGYATQTTVFAQPDRKQNGRQGCKIASFAGTIRTVLFVMRGR